MRTTPLPFLSSGLRLDPDPHLPDGLRAVGDGDRP